MSRLDLNSVSFVAAEVPQETKAYRMDEQPKNIAPQPWHNPQTGQWEDKNVSQRKVKGPRAQAFDRAEKRRAQGLDPEKPATPERRLENVQLHGYPSHTIKGLDPEKQQKVDALVQRFAAAKATQGGMMPPLAALHLDPYRQAFQSGKLDPDAVIHQVTPLWDEAQNVSEVQREDVIAKMRAIPYPEGREKEGPWSLLMQEYPTETRKQRLQANQAAQPIIEQWFRKTAENASRLSGRTVSISKIQEFVPSLSDQQFSAVLSQAPITGILAGAGAGKTNTMVAQVLDDAFNRSEDWEEVLSKLGNLQVLSKTKSAVKNIIDKFKGIETIVPEWTEEKRETQAKTLDKWMRSQLHRRRPGGSIINRQFPGFLPLDIKESGINPETQLTRVLEHVKKLNNVNVPQLSTYIEISKGLPDQDYRARLGRGERLYKETKWQQERGIEPDLALYLYQQSMWHKPGFQLEGQAGPLYDLADAPIMMRAAIKRGNAPEDALPRALFDEFQDFSPSVIQTLVALASPDSRQFYGGDLDQMAVQRDWRPDLALKQAGGEDLTSHILTANYRSVPEVVSFNNTLKARRALQGRAVSPMQIAMKPPSGVYPIPRVEEDIPSLYRSMALDWFKHMGTSIPEVAQKMQKGEHPLTGFALPAQQRQLVFQMRTKGRDTFRHHLQGLLEEHMEPDLASKFMQEYTTTDLPSESNRDKMHHMMLTNVRSREASQYFVDVTQGGLWNDADFTFNLNTMLSRAQHQNLIYGSMSNFPGSQFDLTPETFAGQHVPAGMSSLYQGMAEDLALRQGVRPQNMPMGLKNAFYGKHLMYPTGEQEQSLQDQQMLANYIQDVLMLSQYHPPSSEETGSFSEGSVEHEALTSGYSITGGNGIGGGGFYQKGTPRLIEAAQNELNNLLRQGPSMGEVPSFDDFMQQVGKAFAYAGKADVGDTVASSEFAQDNVTKDFAPGEDHFYEGEDIAQLRKNIRQVLQNAKFRDDPSIKSLLATQHGNPKLIHDILGTVRHYASDENSQMEEIRHHMALALMPDKHLTEVRKNLESQKLKPHEIKAKLGEFIQEKREKLQDIEKKAIIKSLPQVSSIQDFSHAITRYDQLMHKSGVESLSEIEHVELAELKRNAIRNLEPEEKKEHRRLSHILRIGGNNNIQDIISGITTPPDPKTKDKESPAYQNSLRFFNEMLADVIYKKEAELVASGRLDPHMLETLAQRADKVKATLSSPKERSMMEEAAHHFRNNTQMKGNGGIPISEDTIAGIGSLAPTQKLIAQYHPQLGARYRAQKKPYEEALVRKVLTNPKTKEMEDFSADETESRISQLIYKESDLNRTIAKEGKRLGVPIQKSRLYPAIAAFGLLNDSLQGGIGNTGYGVFDPEAVRAIASNRNPAEDDFSYTYEKRGVPLPNLEKRLSERLVRHPQMPAHQQQKINQMLDQVKQVRTGMSNPKNHEDWAHLMRVVMRATTGENVSAPDAEKKDRKPDPIRGWFSNREKSIREHRTLESLIEFMAALNQASTHLQQHGTLKRSHLKRVVNAFGFDINDERFKVLRNLEKSRKDPFIETAKNPDPEVGLQTIIGQLPHPERKGAQEQLTRVPLLPNEGYIFRGGQPGYAGLSGYKNPGGQKEQFRKLGIKPGTELYGTLHPLPGENDFGLSKQVKTHRAMSQFSDSKMDESSDSDFKKQKHWDGEMQYVPILQFQGTYKGKEISFPVTPEQLALGENPEQALAIQKQQQAQASRWEMLQQSQRAEDQKLTAVRLSLIDHDWREKTFGTDSGPMFKEQGSPDLFPHESAGESLWPLGPVPKAEKNPKKIVEQFKDVPYASGKEIAKSRRIINAPLSSPVIQEESVKQLEGLVPPSEMVHYRGTWMPKEHASALKSMALEMRQGLPGKKRESSETGFYAPYWMKQGKIASRAQDQKRRATLLDAYHQNLTQQKQQSQMAQMLVNARPASTVTHETSPIKSYRGIQLGGGITHEVIDAMLAAKERKAKEEEEIATPERIPVDPRLQPMLPGFGGSDNLPPNPPSPPSGPAPEDDDRQFSALSPSEMEGARPYFAHPRFTQLYKVFVTGRKFGGQQTWQEYVKEEHDFNLRHPEEHRGEDLKLTSSLLGITSPPPIVDKPALMEVKPRFSIPNSPQSHANESLSLINQEKPQSLNDSSPKKFFPRSQEQLALDRRKLQSLVVQHPAWKNKEFAKALGYSESWVKKWKKQPSPSLSKRTKIEKTANPKLQIEPPTPLSLASHTEPSIQETFPNHYPRMGKSTLHMFPWDREKLTSFISNGSTHKTSNIQSLLDMQSPFVGESYLTSLIQQHDVPLALEAKKDFSPIIHQPSQLLLPPPRLRPDTSISHLFPWDREKLASFISNGSTHKTSNIQSLLNMQSSPITHQPSPRPAPDDIFAASLALNASTLHMFPRDKEKITAFTPNESTHETSNMQSLLDIRSPFVGGSYLPSHTTAFAIPKRPQSNWSMGPDWNTQPRKIKLTPTSHYDHLFGDQSQPDQSWDEIFAPYAPKNESWQQIFAPPFSIPKRPAASMPRAKETFPPIIQRHDAPLALGPQEDFPPIAPRPSQLLLPPPRPRPDNIFAASPTPDVTKNYRLAHLPGLLREGGHTVNGVKLHPLVPEQRGVLENQAQHHIIQGGPGTGKTDTIATKLADLVGQKRLSPRNILSISGLHSGVEEMNKRYKEFLQPLLPKSEKYQVPQAKTLHAFAHQIVLPHGEPSPLLESIGRGYVQDIIANPSEKELAREEPAAREFLRDRQSRFLQKALSDQLPAGTKIPTKMSDLQFLLDNIGAKKRSRFGESSEYEEAMKLGKEHLKLGKMSPHAALAAYEQALPQEHAADFDDSITIARELLTAHGSQAIPDHLKATQAVVYDEAQDATPEQIAMLSAFQKGLGSQSRMILGLDPMQSLFQGAGSIPPPEIIPSFKNMLGDDVAHHQLVANFRSPQSDVALYNSVLNQSEKPLSPPQIPYLSDPGKKPKFLLSKSEPNLYKKVFSSMLEHTGVPQEYLKENIVAGRHPFHGVDWKTPGLTRPGESPAYFPRRADRKLFEAVAPSVLRQIAPEHITPGMAAQAFSQMYRNGPPGQFDSKAEHSAYQKKEHFLGLMVGQARSKAAKFPHAVVTRTGLWKKDENLQSYHNNIGVELSRVSEGGHQVIAAASRPFESWQAKRFLASGGADFHEEHPESLREGRVFYGPEEKQFVHFSPESAFEQHKGRLVPSGFSEILSGQERQLTQWKQLSGPKRSQSQTEPTPPSSVDGIPASQPLPQQPMSASKSEPAPSPIQPVSAQPQPTPVPDRQKYSSKRFTLPQQAPIERHDKLASQYWDAIQKEDPSGKSEAKIRTSFDLGIQHAQGTLSVPISRNAVTMGNHELMAAYAQHAKEKGYKVGEWTPDNNKMFPSMNASITKQSIPNTPEASSQMPIAEPSPTHPLATPSVSQSAPKLNVSHPDKKPPLPIPLAHRGQQLDRPQHPLNVFRSIASNLGKKVSYLGQKPLQPIRERDRLANHYWKMLKKREGKKSVNLTRKIFDNTLKSSESKGYLSPLTYNDDFWGKKSISFPDEREALAQHVEQQGYEVGEWALVEGSDIHEMRASLSKPVEIPEAMSGTSPAHLSELPGIKGWIKEKPNDWEKVKGDVIRGNAPRPDQVLKSSPTSQVGKGQRITLPQRSPNERRDELASQYWNKLKRLDPSGKKEASVRKMLDLAFIQAKEEGHLLAPINKNATTMENHDLRAAYAQHAEQQGYKVGDWVLDKKSKNFMKASLSKPVELPQSSEAISGASPAHPSEIPAIKKKPTQNPMGTKKVPVHEGEALPSGIGFQKGNTKFQMPPDGHITIQGTTIHIDAKGASGRPASGKEETFIKGFRGFTSGGGRGSGNNDIPINARGGGSGGPIAPYIAPTKDKEKKPHWSEKWLNAGRSIARVSSEMQYTGKLLNEITSSAAQQGSAYRMATTGMPGSGSTADRGFFDFANSQSGISKLQANRLPMYSDVQVAQNLRNVASQTGGFGVNTGTTTSIMQLGAVTGIDPSQLMQQTASYTGTTGQGMSTSGTNKLISNMYGLYGGNLTASNVTPTMQAINSVMPTLQGNAQGQGDQLSQLMTIMGGALKGGATAQNMPDVANAVGTLSQVGMAPDLQQQYVMSQLFPKQLTAGVQLAQYNQQQLGQNQQIEQLSLQKEVDLPRLQIKINNADISMQSANFDLAKMQQSYNEASYANQKLNYQYSKASFAEKQYVDTQEYGPIGADTSRTSYFDFMRHQQQAGYNPLSAETGTQFKPSQPYGLQNMQFYAGIEHQRQDMILSRSPLLSDAKFQEDQKYLNQQEAFYKAQLDLTNQQRKFEVDWTTKLLDSQGKLLDMQGPMLDQEAKILGIQGQQLSLNQLMTDYQNKSLTIQEKYLPLELDALTAIKTATEQFMNGQGPLNGKNASPKDIIQGLAGIKDPNKMKQTVQAMRLSAQDTNTVIQIVQGINKAGGWDAVQKGIKPEDKQLQKQISQLNNSGAFTDSKSQAAVQNAYLQFAGTGGTWSDFVKKFDEANGWWQSIAQSLSILAPTMKQLGTVFEIAGPVLMGAAMVINTIGTVGQIASWIPGVVSAVAGSLSAIGEFIATVAELVSPLAIPLAVAVGAKFGWDWLSGSDAKSADPGAPKNPKGHDFGSPSYKPPMKPGDTGNGSWNWNWIPGQNNVAHADEAPKNPKGHDFGSPLYTPPKRPVSAENQFFASVQKKWDNAWKKIDKSMGDAGKNWNDFWADARKKADDFWKKLDDIRKGFQKDADDIKANLSNFITCISLGFQKNVLTPLGVLGDNINKNILGPLHDFVTQTIPKGFNNVVSDIRNLLDPKSKGFIGAQVAKGVENGLSFLKNWFTGGGGGGNGGGHGGAEPAGHPGFSTPHVNTDFGDKVWYGTGKHQGVDFQAAQGSQLREFVGGKVSNAGWYDWGGEVDVEIPGGITERYLHLSALGVKKGQMVGRGQYLGLTGGGTKQSGLGYWSTGAHSHVQYDHQNYNQGLNPWEIWRKYADLNLARYYGPVGKADPASSGGGGGIPHFAKGGIALSPMIAQVAEREPEAIVPLSRLSDLLKSLPQKINEAEKQTSQAANKSFHVDKLIGNATFNVTTASSTMNDSEKDQLMSDAMDVMIEALKQLYGKLQ